MAKIGQKLVLCVIYMFAKFHDHQTTRTVCTSIFPVLGHLRAVVYQCCVYMHFIMRCSKLLLQYALFTHQDCSNQSLCEYTHEFPHFTYYQVCAYNFCTQLRQILCQNYFICDANIMHTNLTTLHKYYVEGGEMGLANIMHSLFNCGKYYAHKFIYFYLSTNIM